MKEDTFTAEALLPRIETFFQQPKLYSMPQKRRVRVASRMQRENLEIWLWHWLAVGNSDIKSCVFYARPILIIVVDFLISELIVKFAKN